LTNFFRHALKCALSKSEDENVLAVKPTEMENGISPTMRITQVSLIVESQSEALEFYTKKIGFEKKIDFPTPAGYRWIVVGPRGQELGLALVEAGWPDPTGLAKNWKAGTAPPIVLQVEDCSKTYKALRSRGVEFKQLFGEELRKAPYGTVAFFADRDGNTFELLQLPKAP
jgi:catechol 2,3-dioxygenase-like lactoylglutathione lyase family enzyme